MGKCLVMGMSTIVTKIVKISVDFCNVVKRHVATHNFSFTKGECFENFNACFWHFTFSNTCPPFFIFRIIFVSTNTRKKTIIPNQFLQLKFVICNCFLVANDNFSSSASIMGNLKYIYAQVFIHNKTYNQLGLCL